MLSILEHYHQVCQMPNTWHLAHQTPNTNPHQVFQISKFWHEATVHSQIWYGTNINAIIFFAYFIYLFSFLPTHISFSLSLCLQHISISLCLVLSSPSLFLFHHATLISPRHWPPRHVAELRTITTPCHTAELRTITTPCHATPPSLSCRPPRHRNLPPSDLVVQF